MENMIKALVAQGISQDMAESMVKSFKPKKEKTAKKSGWYPGMGKTSTKVDMDVTVSSYCQCCGAKTVKVITMKAVSKDSPDTQRVATSVCNQCPDFVRQFTHEQLVTMLLIGEKPAQELRSASMKFKAQLSTKLTPESVITFTTLSNIEGGK